MAECLVIVEAGRCVHGGLLYYSTDFCFLHIYLKLSIISGVPVLGKLDFSSISFNLGREVSKFKNTRAWDSSLGVYMELTWGLWMAKWTEKYRGWVAREMGGNNDKMVNFTVLNSSYCLCRSHCRYHWSQPSSSFQDRSSDSCADLLPQLTSAFCASLSISEQYLTSLMGIGFPNGEGIFQA